MNDYADLVARFGSPLYVYQLTHAQRALQALSAAVPQPSQIYYSLKANPHPDIVRTFRESGCGAEISSRGELEAAISSGFDPAACLYTGPGKTTSEIELALGKGVRRFSVESMTDLHRVTERAQAVGATAECLLRVSAGPAGSSGLRMTGASSQFGMGMQEVFDNLAEIRRHSGARLTGLHFFPLSNARDEDSLAASFLASIEAAARLRSEAGLTLSFVSLGGGFAAPFAKPGVPPVYTQLRPTLRAALDRRIPGWSTGAPAIAFESGRYLAGECGVLICTVLDIKQSGDRRYVVLDSGINHLGGMSGLGRLLPAAQPAEAADDSPGRDFLVGPLCTPADILGSRLRLGHLEPGQLITIPNTGAYGLTASLLAFLGRPSPAEVVLCGDEIVSVSVGRYERTWMRGDPA